MPLLKKEQRILSANVEIRADGDGPEKIVGYAAVFNSLSEDLGGFREIIRPGAFAAALPVSDTRALWQHESVYVLGRLRSSTLRIEEDERGLRVEIDPPDAQWARDVMVSIKRGDVDQMSFAFSLTADGDRWSREEGELPLREILKVKRLYDVSVVTYPAYPDTVVDIRSLIADRELSQDERRALAEILPAEPNPVTVNHRRRRQRLMSM